MASRDMAQHTAGEGEAQIRRRQQARVAIRPRWWQRKTVRNSFAKLVIMFVLAVGVAIIMVPALWMLSVSLKTDAELHAYPPVWIPRSLCVQNYIDALTLIPFGRLLRNTLIITLCRLVGVVLSSSLVAFGFARFRAPGHDVLFLVVLATMMLPGEVTLIPQFVLFSKLGWVDTFKPLIIPAFFGGGAFNIFLLRQFFMTIPLEYDDAARIDGAGTLRLFFQIILPLSKPALATVATFTIMGSWNDFFGPLIYLRTMTNSTLALGLYFFQGVYNPQWNRLMAMSVLLMLPIVALFFFAQRFFIQGVVVTGLKG